MSGSGSGRGIRGIGIGMPRVSGGPDAQLGVRSVGDYQAAIKQLKGGLDVPNPDPQLLVELNTLATQIQDEDDKNLDQGKKKRFQTVLDNLERDTILKLIKREHNYILTLFQDAQPMTHEKLTPADKHSLQQLILRFAPEILDEELNLRYPSANPSSKFKKAEKLAELLSIYMNLLERLLPTFFGASHNDRTSLFIPDTQAQEGALMVDLAMRAVYQYMVQIKTIGQSASAIADRVVPRTPADIFTKLATFGLTVATLKAISPMLFQLINALATGAGLSVDDIRLIMTEAFRNAGYISAFLLWCNQNRKQITGLSWKIFSNTLGRGMPEAPGAPPNDFKTLFDNLSDITMEAHRTSVTGRRPAFQLDPLRGLECVAYLVRSICYTQADMLATAVSRVPRGLQYLSKQCSRLAQRGLQAVSSYAVGFEATAGTVSPDTYKSFSYLLSQLAETDAKYASLRDNADFRRCMELMQLNNPNPHSLNAARLQASVAQHHQQFGGPLDARLRTESAAASGGDSFQDPETVSSPLISAGQMEYNPHAAGGFGASTGEMLPPNNATFASETSEGLQHSDIVRKDLLGYLNTTTKPADDSMDLDPDDSSGSRGGRSRSRKRSVSKRTRRKATTKKQKSKKNKRQSRRKVRRASSRKDRK